MKSVKGILLLVFVFAITVPCFGSNVAIKRKKNKWLYSEEVVKTINVSSSSQFETVPFSY
ncbi:MAG: hypothetical protein LBS79_06375 [Tannerella sp.]|jgi:hypothetical protein|nr:hypothetical protein [Tannerella sp.]